ncbi:MAG: DNA polymerase III subunit alpha, partial [Chloroflexota bacterium]|nr:DNA polymerase III subunit alpha [Chloroflexota bacterium]
GLLKMDFLGLSNLTILAKAVANIKQNQGITVDLHRLPLDDEKAFNLLASGETKGIFQLEGTGMRRYLEELKPSKFADISAMVALYRPGPMEQIHTFIKAKQGLVPVRYPHPALEGILKETYGVIIYQEQVMFIAQALAGYSLGQADTFRKAMGKKIPRIMKKEEKNFIAGAGEKGIPAELAQEVFSLIEPFAGYAFNKAHSVSYAFVAYRGAYLKANYPAEYMTAFLSTYWDNMEKVRSAVAECRRLGIEVLPPDINKSEVDFSIEKSDGNSRIRFGLTAIKNVGTSPIEHMLAARSQGGAFQSIEDFCSRTDLSYVNRKVLESLIKVGAFDSLSDRGTLLDSIDRIISLAQAEQRMRESGQTSMFGIWTQSSPAPGFRSKREEVQEVSPKQKLDWEKELMGVYFSRHPFDSLNSGLSAKLTASCGEVGLERDNAAVLIAGMVGSVRQAYTRDRRPFVVATLEDLDGSVDVVAWPRVYERNKELWQEGNVLLVRGQVRLREGGVQVNCHEAQLYQQGGQGGEPSASQDRLHLIINVKQTRELGKDVERLRKIMDTLKDYPGQDKVSLTVTDHGETTELEIPMVTVNFCPELESELRKVLGEGSLRLEHMLL